MRTGSKLLAAALGVGVAAAGGWYGYAWWNQRAADEQAAAEVAAMQEKVRDLMRDPESARFRNLRRVGQTLCGEINAKNAMGGYVGYRHFHYNGVLSVDPGEGNGYSPQERIEELNKQIAFLELYRECEAPNPGEAASGASAAGGS
jgi:hypothetical protein